MFRKLYWVTEEVSRDGRSRVIGVYTSIPDLIRNGLPGGAQGNLRLTLTKLDKADGQLGTWEGPKFAGLSEDLQAFIRTDEFSEEQCRDLDRALGQLTHAVA
ncbi:MAG: hypothetical protein ACOYON_01760 [Fimbriimonas sp.]